MKYTVKFNFDCINKRSMISGKSGELDITTEAQPEELKTNEELIGLIASEMARKTKQLILSVEITDVWGK